MTSPIIYETFDQWFHEQEGYGLRSERAEGDVEWLKAAFEAGRAGAIEHAVSVINGEMKDAGLTAAFFVADSVIAKIRKLGEDK